MLQDLGRLNFSRGGEGKDGEDGGDQDADQGRPQQGRQARAPATKSGKRKQPKREVYEEPEPDMPELGGLGYVLFWVILGAGVLTLIIVIARNSTSHKQDEEAPVEPPETEVGATPATTTGPERAARA